MNEVNGRIKLSWTQIVWGIAMLGAIVGSWADVRMQVALLRQEVTMKTAEQEKENGRIWQAVKDAKAHPAPKAD